MRRIQYHRYGGPEEMRLEEVDPPTPARGEIRVRIRAASTNPTDAKIRAGVLKLVTGSRFPRGYGHDFAGVVDAVGPQASRFAIGDAVFGVSGMQPAGAFADQLIIAEAQAWPKPPTASFEVAACLPMASVTDWSGVVDRANLREGQSAFVTGCLGGVGRAAVQLALMRGARVWGNCSACDRDEALALGVEEVGDYRDFDVAAGRGRFDLVFDTAAGLAVGQCRAMAKAGGVAVHAAPSARAFAASLISSHALASARPTPARMEGISRAAEEGHLVPKIARTVPLAEAIPALVHQENGAAPKGKLAIVPQGRGSSPQRRGFRRR